MKYLILILLVGSLFIFGCAKTDISTSQEQEICHYDCVDKGWTYGNYIGHGYCNCYNCEQTLTFEDKTIKLVKC